MKLGSLNKERTSWLQSLRHCAAVQKKFRGMFRLFSFTFTYHSRPFPSIWCFTGKLDLGVGVYIALQCLQGISGASVSALLAASVCLHMEQMTPVLFFGDTSLCIFDEKCVMYKHTRGLADKLWSNMTIRMERKRGGHAIGWQWMFLQVTETRR